MSTMTALSPEVLAKYQPVIGLEVHVQLLTETKAFCGCINRYGGDPNTHVCPTCLGLPGALPVLNRHAVELAVLAAKAIHCEIRETSIFSRKNYFYPDSPEGIPDLAVRSAARRAWLDRRTPMPRTAHKTHRHHPAAPGRRRRQEPARRFLPTLSRAPTST